MPKKDISKILTKGGIKQRLLLLAEDNARAIFRKEPILTEVEVKRLNDSFKTTIERKKFNDFVRYDNIVRTALTNLQGILFEAKMHCSDLRGYILTWNVIEDSEKLVNSVLHEIKDPIERENIARKGSKKVNIFFTEKEIDQEGYIELQTDFLRDKINLKDLKEKPKRSKEYSLLYAINNVKKLAESKIVRYLSWSKALADYMDKYGFNVKTYKEQLSIMNEEIRIPIIGWSKYYGELPNRKFYKNYTRFYKMLEKYNVAPEIKEVNQEEYNYFKTELLEDHE
jgi:hypothetical protein